MKPNAHFVVDQGAGTVVTRDVPMFGFALLAQVQGTCDRIEGCGHFVRILNVWDLCSRSSFWPGHTLRQFSSGRKRVIDYVCCSRPSVSECVLIVLHAGLWIEGFGLKGMHRKKRFFPDHALISSLFIWSALPVQAVK